MKFPLPRNIFPAVNLPPQEAQALENYVTNVVRETRDYYHNFLTTRHGQVDPSEWKKLKQQDGFALYKQYGAATEERRSAWRLQNPERDDEVVPLMLAVGSLDGTVEDCMLGLRTPTSQSMQLKSAMVEDSYVDWAVLGQLVKPSPSQPFHEVAVKWAVKAHPFLVGTVMRVRDIVYVETTGFTTITGLDGIKQPLGYHLKHSVDLPGVHELTEFNIVRARLSYCYLYRQRSERVVDVFLRGFVCAMGEAPELLVVSTVTEIVMSIPKNLECAKISDPDRSRKLTEIGDLGVARLLSPFGTTANGCSDGSCGTTHIVGLLADRPGSDRVLTQTGLFGKCRVEVVLRLTQLASGTLGLGFERDNEGLGGITSRSDQAEGSASLALAGFQTIDISLKGTPSRSPRTRGDLRGRGRSGSGFGRRQSRLDPIQGTRGDVQIVAGEIQIMLLCRDLRSQVGCLRSCKI
ncbi:FYVE-FINGER-CONTAINING RAB5 EFFECTOR PROTEIN RABENOSYN-5-RELATED [Phytophthora cinnamomi]|uniref:FYVE-FINGER-CONTAINING RAB5 EFFECTOR PROTEIN RABENOSYN-5-RELATED n=1 Tax=Phytophthora cinnamomi TaxID=4785 RepID=UPI00355A0AD8|nr:FYVE-FINGER-CONTAINING RAB5 EFFECTOR PROTEIN RABENOSYN-5-RELATED [Phytophthora cinnamomi]